MPLRPLVIRASQLDDLPNIIVQHVTGAMMEQALEDLQVAHKLYRHCAEIENLREDMRSYCVSMVALLDHVQSEHERLVQERIAALESQITQEEKTDNAEDA